MDDINQAPVFKSIDDPWIGLLVLSIFTFVLSIIAMLVLYYFWRRHKRRTQFYNESYILSNNPTGKSQIPIQIQDQQPIPYETQRVDAFVPESNPERIHGRYSPHDDIQRAHQFYERTTQGYF